MHGPRRPATCHDPARGRQRQFQFRCRRRANRALTGAVPRRSDMSQGKPGKGGVIRWSPAAGPGARLRAAGATRRGPSPAGTPEARIRPSQAGKRSLCAWLPFSRHHRRPTAASPRPHGNPGPAPAPAACLSHLSGIPGSVSTGDRARQGAIGTFTVPRPACRCDKNVSTSADASSARDGPQDRHEKAHWRADAGLRHPGVVPLLRREFAFGDSRESLERQWLSVGCRHLR